MCLISDFLASAIKYESEANTLRKLDTRSDSRKGAFDMLETWMPGVVVIGIFYTYLIPIQAVTASRGRLKVCPAQSNLQAQTIIGTLGQGKIKIFFQPVCFASGAVALPREPQSVVPQKACSTGDAGVLMFPSVHWWKQSMSPPLTPMRRRQSRRWFLLHVSSSTDAPTLCALLAFVTTPET